MDNIGEVRYTGVSPQASEILLDASAQRGLRAGEDTELQAEARRNVSDEE
jgi:hypothetical protein